MNLQVEFYRASHSSRFPRVGVCFGLGVLGGPQATGVMAYVSRRGVAALSGLGSSVSSLGV